MGLINRIECANSIYICMTNLQKDIASNSGPASIDPYSAEMKVNLISNCLFWGQGDLEFIGEGVGCGGERNT